MILQDDIQQLRKAYDAFLERYPLCYGYWKKYAEAEKRHAASSSAATDLAAAAAGSNGSSGSSVEAAAAVYQRAVAAVPHSAELWVAYAALLQGSDAPTDTVRRWGGYSCVADFGWAAAFINMGVPLLHSQFTVPTWNIGNCTAAFATAAAVCMRPPLLLLAATTLRACCGTSTLPMRPHRAFHLLLRHCIPECWHVPSKTLTSITLGKTS